MTSAQLRRRAEARGVTTAYRDWRGRRTQVSDETLMAVLDALGPELAQPGPGRATDLGHLSGDPSAPAGPRFCSSIPPAAPSLCS